MTTTPSRPAAAPPAPGAPLPRRPVVDVRIKALRRFAASITVFNIVGHIWLGFEQARIVPILCLLASYSASLAFETIDCWALGRRPDYAGGWRYVVNFLLPAHIVGLASGMLLYGNSSPWPYIFAVVVANASKYLVRVKVRGRYRHVFNPSNTGVAVTLLLFPWVGAAPPYQFTNFTTGIIDWLLPLLVLTTGTMLNAQLTRKMPLIAGWIGGFGAQALLRAIFLHHSLVGALLPLTGVGLVLFTNYMITDPGTTPMQPGRQAVFGASTALLYGVLVVAGVGYGFFFALMAICAARGVLMFTGPRLPPWWSRRRSRAAGSGGR
jgi:enediyne biosynthesis protein E5